MVYNDFKSCFFYFRWLIIFRGCDGFFGVLVGEGV